MECAGNEEGEVCQKNANAPEKKDLMMMGLVVVEMISYLIIVWFAISMSFSFVEAIPIFIHISVGFSNMLTG